MSSLLSVLLLAAVASTTPIASPEAEPQIQVSVPCGPGLSCNAATQYCRWEGQCGELADAGEAIKNAGQNVVNNVQGGWQVFTSIIVQTQVTPVTLTSLYSVAVPTVGGYISSSLSLSGGIYIPTR